MNRAHPLTISPFIGVGTLLLGMTQHETRQVVGEEPRNFKQKLTGGEADQFVQNGIMAHYDSSLTLNYIELRQPPGDALPQSIVQLEGVALLERPPAAVLKDLARLGLRGIYDGVGYQFAEIGVRIYAPGRESEGDVVESVGVGPRPA